MSEIIQGDCREVLKSLPDASVDCCITSPPYYGLRDYGIDKQIGLEQTPEEYVEKLTDVFHEVKRVLKDDGTLWLNIGDTYNGLKVGNTETVKHRCVSETNHFRKEMWNGAKQKDLIGIPWMVAFALRADGWYLRQDIIWRKPNPMPESVKDRCTKSHEYIFLMSKKPHYYFDYKAIQEEAVTGETIRDKNAEGYQADYPNGNRFSEGEHIYGEGGKRNKRDVWEIATRAVKEAHFATYPEELVEPCIRAGSRVGGVILDPFFGSGTTGKVAEQLNREYIGIDLNPEYIEIAKRRTSNLQMSLEGLMKEGEA